MPVMDDRATTSEAADEERRIAAAHAHMVGHTEQANPDELIVQPTMSETCKWSTDLTLEDFWP
jgi:hypothetical protein